MTGKIIIYVELLNYCAIALGTHSSILKETQFPNIINNTFSQRTHTHTHINLINLSSLPPSLPLQMSLYNPQHDWKFQFCFSFTYKHEMAKSSQRRIHLWHSTPRTLIYYRASEIYISSIEPFYSNCGWCINPFPTVLLQNFQEILEVVCMVTGYIT